MRRGLGLRAKSEVLVEERDGGIFIRPVPKGGSFAPIDYLPPGTIEVSETALALDAMAAEDDVPRP
jgi:hypothetical protein